MPANTSIDDRYLDIYEAAEYLKVSPQVVRNGALDIHQPLRHVRIGRRYRFKKTWLDEWVAGEKAA